jgi:hypothetical protein
LRARRSRKRTRKYNPHHRRHVAHRRRHRNPIFGGGFIGGTVMDAGVGAVGAMFNDIVWSFIPLPAQFKSGAIGTLAKAGTTIAVGMLSSKLVGSGMAKKATTGALTVQLYSYLKPMLAGMGVPGLGYYGAGYALNEYISDIPSSVNGLNAFVPNSLMDADIDSMGDKWGGSQLIDSSTYPGRFVGEYIPMR